MEVVEGNDLRHDPRGEMDFDPGCKSLVVNVGYYGGSEGEVEFFWRGIVDVRLAARQGASAVVQHRSGGGLDEVEIDSDCATMVDITAP